MPMVVHRQLEEVANHSEVLARAHYLDSDSGYNGIHNQVWTVSHICQSGSHVDDRNSLHNPCSSSRLGDHCCYDADDLDLCLYFYSDCVAGLARCSNYSSWCLGYAGVDYSSATSEPYCCASDPIPVVCEACNRYHKDFDLNV